VTAASRTPREKWIEAGLHALGDGGPDAVRVEALARTLGVTKGGFYWHFDDRRSLLDEVLDAWERTSVDEVIARVDAEAGDARAQLRRLFGLAGAHPELLEVDHAVREWARRDATAARRLRRVDNRRIAYLRTLFGAVCADADEVEARALLTMALYAGGPFVAADHEGRSRAEVLELTLRRLLA
jgi:AcrR family transcriptional regulator